MLAKTIKPYLRVKSELWLRQLHPGVAEVFNPPSQNPYYVECFYINNKSMNYQIPIYSVSKRNEIIIELDANEILYPGDYIKCQYKLTLIGQYVMSDDSSKLIILESTSFPVYQAFNRITDSAYSVKEFPIGGRWNAYCQLGKWRSETRRIIVRGYPQQPQFIPIENEPKLYKCYTPNENYLLNKTIAIQLIKGEEEIFYISGALLQLNIDNDIQGEFIYQCTISTGLFQTTKYWRIDYSYSDLMNTLIIEPNYDIIPLGSSDVNFQCSNGNTINNNNNNNSINSNTSTSIQNNLHLTINIYKLSYFYSPLVISEKELIVKRIHSNQIKISFFSIGQYALLCTVNKTESLMYAYKTIKVEDLYSIEVKEKNLFYAKNMQSAIIHCQSRNLSTHDGIDIKMSYLDGEAYQFTMKGNSAVGVWPLNKITRMQCSMTIHSTFNISKIVYGIIVNDIKLSITPNKTEYYFEVNQLWKIGCLFNPKDVHQVVDYAPIWEITSQDKDKSLSYIVHNNWLISLSDNHNTTNNTTNNITKLSVGKYTAKCFVPNHTEIVPKYVNITVLPMTELKITPNRMIVWSNEMMHTVYTCTASLNDYPHNNSSNTNITTTTAAQLTMRTTQTWMKYISGTKQFQPIKEKLIGIKVNTSNPCTIGLYCCMLKTLSGVIKKCFVIKTIAFPGFKISNKFTYGSIHNYNQSMKVEVLPISVFYQYQIKCTFVIGKRRLFALHNGNQLIHRYKRENDECSQYICTFLSNDMSFVSDAEQICSFTGDDLLEFVYEENSPHNNRLYKYWSGLLKCQMRNETFRNLIPIEDYHIEYISGVKYPIIRNTIYIYSALTTESNNLLFFKYSCTLSDRHSKIIVVTERNLVDNPYLILHPNIRYVTHNLFPKCIDNYGNSMELLPDPTDLRPPIFTCDHKHNCTIIGKHLDQSKFFCKQRQSDLMLNVELTLLTNITPIFTPQYNVIYKGDQPILTCIAPAIETFTNYTFIIELNNFTIYPIYYKHQYGLRNEAHVHLHRLNIRKQEIWTFTCRLLDNTTNIQIGYAQFKSIVSVHPMVLQLKGDTKITYLTTPTTITCSLNGSKSFTPLLYWDIIHGPMKCMHTTGRHLKIIPQNACYGVLLARCYAFYENIFISYIEYKNILLPMHPQISLSVEPMRRFLFTGESITLKVILEPRDQLSDDIIYAIMRHANITILHNGNIVYQQIYIDGKNGNTENNSSITTEMSNIKLTIPSSANRNQMDKSIEKIVLHLELFESSYVASTEHEIRIIDRPKMLFPASGKCSIGKQFSPNSWSTVSLIDGYDVSDIFSEQITWPYSMERNKGIYQCVHHLKEAKLHTKFTRQNSYAPHIKISIVPNLQWINTIQLPNFQCILDNWMYSTVNNYSIYFIRIEDTYKLFNIQGNQLIPRNLSTSTVTILYECILEINEQVYRESLNLIYESPLEIRPKVYMVQLETNTSVIYHLYVSNNETVKPVNWSYTILQVTPDLDAYINQIGFDGQLMITPLFRQYRKPGSLMLQVWIKSTYKEGFIETVQNVHFRVLVDTIGTLNGNDGEDIEVFAGSDKIFRCGYLPPTDFPGVWSAKILNGPKDIVKFETNQQGQRTEVFIKPPTKYPVYITGGKIIIECTFTDPASGQKIFSFNKTFSILDNAIGTLNGLDDKEIIISVGSNETFSCGMLPYQSEDAIKGYWTARIVDGDTNDLIYLEEVSKHILIKPPVRQPFYMFGGYAKIECVFRYTSNKQIVFEFNKTITITGSINGTLNGIDDKDVKLIIGTNKTLRCGLLPASFESRLVAKWTGKIISGPKDLVAINIDKENGQTYIQPLAKHGVYLKEGEFIFQCILQHARKQNYIIYGFNRTVTITSCDYRGTLNGIDDSSHIILPLGSSKQLNCSLLPGSVDTQVNGYWNGSLSDGLHEILSLSHQNGQVFIDPPNGSTVYDNQGQVRLTCSFIAKSNNYVIFKMVADISVSSCNIRGTLNSIDDSNLVIRYGSSRTYKCGILPNIEEAFNGYWIADIISGSNDTVSIVQENNQSYIKPPLFSDAYTVTGTIQLECSLKSKSRNHSIYSFRKFITVYKMHYERLDIEYTNEMTAYIGSSTKFKCYYKLDNFLKTYYNGYWIAKIADGDKDIISVVEEDIEANGEDGITDRVHNDQIIQPPSGSHIYTKSGKVFINCTFIDPVDDGRVVLSSVKIISILKTQQKGTLNGIDDKDVTVKLGTSKTFQCGILMNDQNIQGYWTGSLVHGQMDAVSLIHDNDNNNNKVKIKPRKCSSVYDIKGSVDVKCTFMNMKHDIQFMFTKTIHIVDAGYTGSLNGLTDSDVTVPVGSSDIIKCGLLPNTNEFLTIGYWYARIVNGNKEMISIKICNGQALIQPTNNTDVFYVEGVVEIECILKRYDNNNEVIFAFNKTFEVNDGDYGSLDGKTTGDVDVIYLSKDKIKCSYLYPSIAKQVNGYWNGKIIEGISVLVKVSRNASDIYFLPPRSNGFDYLGSVRVQCSLIQQKSRKTLLTYYRWINVILKDNPVALNVYTEKDTYFYTGSSTRGSCYASSLDESSTDDTYWKVDIINGDSDIIAIDDDNNNYTEPLFRPPFDKTVYEKVGHVEVQCTLLNKTNNTLVYSAIKNIYIIATHRKGTLNGIDESNITVEVNSNKTFECGILPKEDNNNSTTLQQYWRGRIVSSSTTNKEDIVHLDMSTGKVIIRPPKQQDTYRKTGQVVIECLMKYTLNEIEFGFNKTFSVIDINMKGTLNGIDEFNVTTSIGSHDTFKCGTLPTNAERNYDAYWIAKVVDGNADNAESLIFLSSCSQTVNIQPKYASYGYHETGHVTIECTLIERSSERVILSFTRTLEIIACGMDGTLNGVNTLDLYWSIGTNKTAECGLLPNRLVKQLNGYWEVEILTGLNDLISLRSHENRTIITPPKDYQVYYNVGETEVRCILKNYEDKRTVFEFTKKVTITDCEIDGTLNGIDNSNIDLHFYSNEQFACGILPKHIEKLINGYWTGRIIRGRKEMISLEIVNHSVIITPPSGYKTYLLTGFVEIECIYKDFKNNREFYKFSKYINVFRDDTPILMNMNENESFPIFLNSKRPIMCGGLSFEELNELKIFWAVNITGGKRDIIAVNLTHDNNQIIIPPKSGNGSFSLPGQIRVLCILRNSPDGEYLHSHTKIINITEYNTIAESIFVYDVQQSNISVPIGSDEEIPCDSSLRSSSSSSLSPSLELCSQHRGRQLKRPVGSLCYYWRGKIINNSSNVEHILSLDKSNDRVIIKPPKCSPFYKMKGYATVECTLLNQLHEIKMKFIKTVRITDPILIGTLNGIDESNVTVLLNTSKTYQCGFLPMNYVKSGIYTNGQWNAKVLDGGTPNLISITKCHNQLEITPPSGLSTYSTIGQVLIECSFTLNHNSSSSSNQTLFSFIKSFSVITHDQAGTLNGYDSSNIIVPIDSSDKFQCGLLYGIDAWLKGYWKANIISGLKNLVSLNKINGQVFIEPPHGSKYYNAYGEITIECIFINQDNDNKMFSFIKNLTIENYRIEFFPKNQIIYIGDKDEITCAIVTKQGSIIYEEGSLHVQLLSGDDSLIEIDNTDLHPVIKPRKKVPLVYDKPGEFHIQCVFTNYKGYTLRKQLHVQISG
ncbi:unnamed protein product [Trichobilharzia szidati]|nr:unnamed protein product [Trichobilharzia szidati]